ncbi:hypothetical protein G7Y79_00059g091600 [Physcia stellaris]|nr:hypothetical protein G7Y79_00059g091600 [Physcia stellaris]
MADPSKLAADSAADHEPLQHRAKTTFEPSLMTPSQKQSMHTILQTPSRSSKHQPNHPILLRRHSLLEWTGGGSPPPYIAKESTLADERFLRNNESLAPQVKTTVSKWDIATRALTTFHDIFAMPVKDKTDAQLALTAARNVIDYAMIYYMTGTCKSSIRTASK